MTEIENEDELTVRKVYNIVVKKRKVNFLCKQYRCCRDHLGYFRPTEILSDMLSLVSNIEDPQPIYPVGTGDIFLFVLKYNISFS